MLILFLLVFYNTSYYFDIRNSSYLYFGPSYDQVLEPGRNSISIEHDGINRTFWVETPASYSPNHKYPVLVYYHYFGGSGTGTSMEAMINEENFIGVYPNGIHNTWNSGVISDDDDYIKPDDYGFTIKMIDWMLSLINI